MKKRAVEAAVILLALAALFAALNFAAEQAAENTVKIDGDYYNTGIAELSLTVMTEEGLYRLEEFPRLTNLKITPFKEAAANAAAGDDPAARAAVLREYENCTELSDLSVISGLTGLERLDVSYCHVSDLDFIMQMKGLVSLNIGCTEITDISPLTNFPKMERLIIYGTPAKELSPLLEMEGLKTVILSEDTAEEFAEVTEQLKNNGVEVEARE